jgi:hypothetical protein
LETSSYLDELLSQGLVYCDPSRELNVLVGHAIGFTDTGLRSHTDIPALKQLEAQKEMRVVAKLDPFFERIRKFASRRLKREIERQGTLGEPDAPYLERIPPEESGSDLLRSMSPMRDSQCSQFQKVAQRPCRRCVIFYPDCSFVILSRF